MIPIEIQNLVSLALKDGILTYKERQVIVKKAKKMRLDMQEVNSYINTALDNKMKFIPKEDLKRCPTCGAQIPLISDECQYCGFEFGQGISYSKNNSASQIIQKENENSQSVYVKSQNINNCPDCGAPFPLLSNICPHCHHVHHENIDSVYNIKQLIQKIKHSLSSMDKCMVPLKKSILRDHALYLIPLSGLLMTLHFNLNIMSPDLEVIADIAFLLSAGLMFYILIALFFRILQGSAIDEADEVFVDKKSDYERFIRQTESLYGDDREAKVLLHDFENEIKKVKNNRLRNRSVYYLFCIFSGLLIWLLISKAGGINISDSNNFKDLNRYIPCGVITSDGLLAQEENSIECENAQVLSQGFLNCKYNELFLDGVKVKFEDKSKINDLSVLFFNSNGKVIEFEERIPSVFYVKELGNQEYLIDFSILENVYTIMNTAKSFSIISK